MLCDSVHFDSFTSMPEGKTNFLHKFVVQTGSFNQQMLAKEATWQVVGEHLGVNKNFHH